MQQADQQYQKLLTEVIKKQIIVLGPAITLAKARNVKGLTISEDGTVTGISGNPQEIIHELTDQFMQLSSLIAKKTIDPILASFPGILLSIQPDPTPAIQEAIVSSQITPPANQQAIPSTPPLQNPTNANQKPETNESIIK